MFEQGIRDQEQITADIPVGDIPDASIIDNPFIKEASRRKTSTSKQARSFLTEVKGIDRIRRFVFLGVGLLENIFDTSLTFEEIAGLVSEIRYISDYTSKNQSLAFVSGFIFAALLLMTRKDTPVSIPTISKLIPPPAKKTLPSYFYYPVVSNSDQRMIKFLYEVLEFLSKTHPYYGNIIKKTVDAKESYIQFTEVASQLARSSPLLIERTFEIQRQATRNPSKEPEAESRILRRMGEWETIPVGYRPSPTGLLLKYGRRLIVDSIPLLTDVFGIPIRENSVLSSSLLNPSLKNILKSLGRERSETFIKMLYQSSSDDKKTVLNTVLYSPAYGFIGTVAEKIPEKILSKSEESIYLEKTDPVKLLELHDPDTITFKPTSSHTDLITKLRKNITDIVNDTIFGQPTEEYAELVIQNMLNIGNGIQTRETGDANGSLRCELISIIDAISIASQEILQSIRGETMYTTSYQRGGPINTETTRIYGIFNRVKNLMPGISVVSIEEGPRLGVLGGKNSYYEQINYIKSLFMTDIKLQNEKQILSLINILNNLRQIIIKLPNYISREFILHSISKNLYDNARSGDEDVFVAIDALICLFGSRYDTGKEDDFGIIGTLREMASSYTDVSPSMVYEEANKDREMERQRFIYQLEGLDKEERKITKAMRSLGIDLAGKVALNPTKFNPEFYIQQTDMLADQEIRTEEESSERTREFGDTDDTRMMEAAQQGAPMESEQIEGVDYD